MLILPLTLSGCSIQKKPSTTATATATSSSTSSTDTNPTNQATTSQTPAADTSAITTQYQTNYSTAAADANQILQNTAKFCAVEVKSSGTNVLAATNQFFFFYSDTLLTDYYWLVEFDGANSNAKKRYFAAKRDFKDEIACVSTQPTAPPSFVDAFTNYLTQYQIPTTTASIQMSLKDTMWDLVARDSSGAITSSGQATSAASKTQSTTSPTTSETAAATL